MDWSSRNNRDIPETIVLRYQKNCDAKI